MVENILYALLLALHNIVLVLVAGGCFAVWQASLKIERLESLGALERTTIVNPRTYIQGLIVLGLTGMGMPLIHMLYHGDIKPQTAVSMSAFIIKMILVCFLLVVTFRWAIDTNKQTSSSSNSSSNKKNIDFFTRRRGYAQWGWIIAVLILVITPFITFFQE